MRTIDRLVALADNDGLLTEERTALRRAVVALRYQVLALGAPARTYLAEVAEAALVDVFAEEHPDPDPSAGTRPAGETPR